MATVALLGAGCNHEPPELTPDGERAADAYVQAVYVRRDCAAAGRLAHPPDGTIVDCDRLREHWWDDDWRLVRDSAKTQSPCMDGGLISVDGDCRVYRIAARTERGFVANYLAGDLWLFLDRVDGRWVVVATSYQGGACSTDVADSPTKCVYGRDWVQTIEPSRE